MFSGRGIASFVHRNSSVVLSNQDQTLSARNEEVFMAKFRLLATLGVLLLVVALTQTTAWAAGIDPPFQIGPCSSGSTFCGAHPNDLGMADFITFHLGGSQNSDVAGIYLIVGVPIVNGSFAALPGISLTSPIAGTLGGGGGANYGATWNAGTGDGGTFSKPAQGTTTVYDVLTFDPPGDSSENSSNWFAPFTGQNSGGNLLGVDAFELFVYTLDPTGITGNFTGVVNFTGDLPLGAMVIGYACSQVGTIDSCSNNAGDVWSTPFTQAGLVTSGPERKLPEPGGLALLGSGLVMMGGLLRRKFRSTN
jgi:hypothetical protein